MNKSQSKYFNTANKMDEAFLSLLDKKSFEYITVKEICEKAGVHRSTFYLHYETLDDLLTECNEYIVKKFTSFMAGKRISHRDIQRMPLNELNFITPQYLIPWLEFIKKNKALFRTYVSKFSTLTMKKNNGLLFINVLNPILERYSVNETDRPYLLKFYIEGVMALVKHWVSNDCKEETEYICKLIINCVTYEKN